MAPSKSDENAHEDAKAARAAEMWARRAEALKAQKAAKQEGAAHI